jgi:hypothetical protein
MAEYFEKFPVINYNGKNMRDLTRRVNFLKNSLDDPYVFLPYTVEDDMRPEDIAYYYYGSTEYTWLVYLANDIIDPYHQWPLSQEKFDAYLINKYSQQSGRTGYDVIAWLQDETIEENLLYYYREFFPGSSFTFTTIQAPETTGFTQPLEVRVSVSAEEKLATGSVELYVNDELIETRTLSNGSILFTVDSLPKGIYALEARYLGSTTHISSISEEFTHRVI